MTITEFAKERRDRNPLLDEMVRDLTEQYKWLTDPENQEIVKDTQLKHDWGANFRWTIEIARRLGYVVYMEDYKVDYRRSEA